MKYDVYKALQQICQRWPEHGKMIEKVLAIAFDRVRAGFMVESRSTEGVDLELVGASVKYAIEVKTTSNDRVILAEKDITGLRSKSTKDGYIPVVAALSIHRSSDWVLARADHLAPNRYTLERLSLDSMPELQAIARTYFESTFLELREKILDPPYGLPLMYLDTILTKESRLKPV